MNKKGDIPMGKPRVGAAVSEATWKKYLKKKKKKEDKKAREQPKTIPARNFAAEAVRKAAEAQGSGRAYQNPFASSSFGSSEGLWVGRPRGARHQIRETK